MKMLNKLCISGMLMALTAMSTTIAIAEPPRAPTIKVETTRKAILDEDFSWMTTAQADKLVDDIAAAGFNILIPVVWHGRGTSWPSKMAPMEDKWEFSKPRQKDPLRYLIDRAHSRGIEVHPWFTISLRQRPILTQYYNSGTPEESFDVRNPAFREYIVNLMLEVVKNYDVDGINLDYIRSGGICTSKECLDDYKAKNGGKDVRDDYKKIFRYDDSLKRVAAWNEPYITDIVKRFSTQAKQIKPNLIISVDTHPGWKDFQAQGANSIAWANAGLIDVIYDMQYMPEIDVKAFNEALAKLNDPSKLVLMVGNYEATDNKPKPWIREAGLVSKLVAQAQKINPHNGGAVAVYEYPFLSSEQVKSIKAGPFAKPDTLPAGSVIRQ